jgi:ATP-dependent Clp protease ATP-binding subunit ClpA
MADLDYYLDKFSDSGKRVLKSAFNESRRRNKNCTSPEHILYALLEEEKDLFDSTLSDLSVDANSIRLSLEKRLENSRQHTGQGFRITPETTDLFRFSLQRARSQGRRVIEANDILYELITDKYSLLNNILQNLDKS